MNKIFKNYKFIISIFVILMLLNCFTIYGQINNKKEIMEDMANIWAESWKTRDGKPRYEMMSEKMKKEFEKKQGKTEEGNLIYNIRWSSPWVENYTVDVDEDNETAQIGYIMKTSPNDYYIMWDYIAFDFNKSSNKTEVIACVSSGLFNYDKPHEYVSKEYPHSFTYAEPKFQNDDFYGLTHKIYMKLARAAASMISTEFICEDKFISLIDFKEIRLDNMGKMVIIDADMIARTTIMPVNPAKDEKLKNLKSKNIDEYIKLFSNYNLNSTTDIKYTLKAKVDLEYDGIVSIDLQHNDD